MLQKLFPYRFEAFFFSQIAILFGSLIVPAVFFEAYVSPVLFQINLLAGVLLLSKQKKIMWFFIALLVVTAVLLGSEVMEYVTHDTIGFIRMVTYFLFYTVVTIELIKQVWNAKQVNKNVILGLISGYIALGLIGFFICLSIEIAYPNSFSGFVENISITENLMYYSYITLLTIGYGDILPVTGLAHKAGILIGLMGQMYLVVLTAIVVGKYINQTNLKK